MAIKQSIMSDYLRESHELRSRVVKTSNGCSVILTEEEFVNALRIYISKFTNINVANFPEGPLVHGSAEGWRLSFYTKESTSE